MTFHYSISLLSVFTITEEPAIGKEIDRRYELQGFPRQIRYQPITPLLVTFKVPLVAL
jgi:hypothetical protein